MVEKKAAALEADIVNQFADFKEGLELFKVQRLRRALRIFPGDMRWQFEDGQCALQFTLQSGSYATMVLRELLELKEGSHFNIND